jgi:hypothetical protein
MKRRKQDPLPPPSRYDSLTQNDLVNCIEAEIGRSAELFRGLSQKTIDNEWVLQEMKVHLESAVMATRALHRKVAVVQSL